MRKHLTKYFLIAAIGVTIIPADSEAGDSNDRNAIVQKTDQLPAAKGEKPNTQSDVSAKRADILDGADVEIQYGSGIDRNRAPGLVQAVIDFFDFLCFWK